MPFLAFFFGTYRALTKRGNLGIFNLEMFFSVAKATRKCHAHMQPSELKPREREITFPPAAPTVCSNQTSPLVIELHLYMHVFDMTAAVDNYAQ